MFTFGDNNLVWNAVKLLPKFEINLPTYESLSQTIKHLRKLLLSRSMNLPESLSLHRNFRQVYYSSTLFVSESSNITHREGYSICSQAEFSYSRFEYRQDT
ncbi:hypothetical protein HI914_05401 [Erysiphe necator]|nr:hypothetical protein HI914_05401 [Erysiphe necator]